MGWNPIKAVQSAVSGAAKAVSTLSQGAVNVATLGLTSSTSSKAAQTVSAPVVHTAQSLAFPMVGVGTFGLSNTLLPKATQESTVNQVVRDAELIAGVGAVAVTVGAGVSTLAAGSGANVVKKAADELMNKDTSKPVNTALPVAPSSNNVPALIAAGLGILAAVL